MPLLPGSYAALIEEFVAEQIISTDLPPRKIISAATIKFATASAIEAAFAFVAVASALEQPVFSGTKNNQILSTEMYRCIAAFVADIYAVETLNRRRSTCKDVYEFWAVSKDTFFA